MSLVFWRVMRGALGWLGIVATGVSALLMVGAIVVWARGYWQLESFAIRHMATQGTVYRQDRWEIEWSGGTVKFEYIAFEGDSRGAPKFFFSDEGWHTQYERGRLPAVNRRQAVRLELTPALGDRVWRFDHAGVVMGVLDAPFPSFYRPTHSWAEAWLHLRVLACSTWMLVVVFAVLPVWRAGVFVRRRVRKRRQDRKGLCVECGYDLRATPDADGPRLARCPECGRITGSAGAAVSAVSPDVSDDSVVPF